MLSVSRFSGFAVLTPTQATTTCMTLSFSHIKYHTESFPPLLTRGKGRLSKGQRDRTQHLLSSMPLYSRKTSSYINCYINTIFVCLLVLNSPVTCTLQATTTAAVLHTGHRRASVPFGICGKKTMSLKGQQDDRSPAGSLGFICWSGRKKKIKEEDLEASTNELITTHESFWALIPMLVGPRQWPSMFIHTSQMNRLMLEINGHFC